MMNNKDMKRAHFLKECREAKGISQNSLAKQLYMASRSSIIKWEKGEAFPKEDMLLKLSEIYGVSLEELESGELINEDDDFKEKKNPFFKWIILVVLFMFLIFLVYFVIEKEKVEIYKLFLDTDYFKIENSTLTLSKKVSIFDLNQIETKNDEKILKVKVYYMDKNNKENLIILTENENIFIEEDYGYGEYNLYGLKGNELYIDISTDKKDYKRIKINMDLVSKDFFFRKEQKIGSDNEIVFERKEIELDEDFLIDQGFLFDKDSDIFIKSIGDNIFLNVDGEKILLSIYLDDNNSVVHLDARYNYDNIMYMKYAYNELVENNEVFLKNEKNCSKKKCSSIDDYIEYVNYLKNNVQK